jgi:hypothetical protein
MTPSSRPQDHLRLREGAAPLGARLIEPRSVVLWTALSLPLIGYFVWYYRAQRDCTRLLNDGSDPWFWMVMLFPGMLLLIPYAAAQARVVARVEVASESSLGTVGYLALCLVGFVIPAAMPLVLQPRLNRAARIGSERLRHMPTA